MEQPLQPRKRIEFIDLLRGWAVIVMIETHVFNATLTLWLHSFRPQLIGLGASLGVLAGYLALFAMAHANRARWLAQE